MHFNVFESVCILHTSTYAQIEHYSQNIVESNFTTNERVCRIVIHTLYLNPRIELTLLIFDAFSRISSKYEHWLIPDKIIYFQKNWKMGSRVFCVCLCVHCTSNVSRCLKMFQLHWSSLPIPFINCLNKEVKTWSVSQVNVRKELKKNEIKPTTTFQRQNSIFYC